MHNIIIKVAVKLKTPAVPFVGALACWCAEWEVTISVLYGESGICWKRRLLKPVYVM